MDLLHLSARSKSSSTLKNKPSLIKELQKIAKMAATPTSRRNLLKSVAVPQTTKASTAGKSYENWMKKPKTPSSHGTQSVKRSASKGLTKTPSHDFIHKISKKTSESNLSAMKKSVEGLGRQPMTPRGSGKISKSSPRGASASKQTFSLITKAKHKATGLKSHEKIITAISSRTATGSVNGKLKPNNQDDFFIHSGFSQNHSHTLLGVMDGHGIYGHEVSSYVKRQLPLLIENNLPYESNI